MRTRTIALALLLACAPALLRAAAPALPYIPRATHAFTLLADATPHVMYTNGMMTVRLQVQNDGTKTWDSDGAFHFAYHWLDREDRVLIRDGVRTALDHPVPPRDQMTVDVRVEAPDLPGVYHLQWDIVQEGVTWFSDRDPKPAPPRTVIVLPGEGLLGALLPPIFALLVWFGLRQRHREARAASGQSRHIDAPPATPGRSGLVARGRAFVVAFAGVADVVWAAFSIFGLQLFVFDEAGIHSSSTGFWISAALAVVPCAVIYLCSPRRWRVWLEWTLVLIAAVVLLSDLLYVRFFGDMISIAAISASGQAGDVWSSVASLFSWGDLLWIVGLPLGILLCRAVLREPEAPSPLRWTTRGAVSLAAVIIVAAAGSNASASDLAHDNSLTQVFRNVWLVREVGPLGFHVFDAWREARDRMLQPKLTAAQRAEVRRWFESRANRRAGVGPWFGAARGMNVLIIQVESMQRFVIGLQVNGQEITPNLNRWRREALWFSNVTDQTNQGRTSDAEFTTMASLLPLPSGAMSFRHGSNHYTALPSVLADHGYSTLSAIPFDGSFWNRLITHPQYGITTNLFDDDFQPGERVGWGLNDRDFFKQMGPRIAALHQPFFTWLITLSLHHPFTSFPDNLKTLKLGPWEGTAFGNYLHGIHFFDEAFGELEATLKKQGLFDHTVIVVYGDHDAGLPHDPRFARMVGIPDRSPGLSPSDGVPLFIRVPGTAALEGERTLPAGLTDVAPTVLALTGIDPAGLPYVGRNLLGEPGDDPIVRPYGSWVDGRHFFVPDLSGARDGQCQDAHTRATVPIAECRAEMESAAREAEISRRVTAYDLQTQLVEAPRSTSLKH
jgi:phosphoglycerol transferase MdoB-like AlkP superfamily enzyme